MMPLAFVLALGLQAPPLPSPAPAYSLEVRAGAHPRLRFAGDGALLEDVAREIGQKLKVRVTVSPDLQGLRLKANFSLLPLEDALSHLAPRAHLDYKATSGPNGGATLMAIFLQSAAEDPPPLPPDSHTTLVIEGDTEDETVESLQPDREARDEASLLHVPADGPFIQVSYRHGLVTLRAHDHSKAAIMSDLAGRLGVPFTLHSGADTQPIDLEIVGVQVDELARWLPPDVALLYRREAVTRTLTPLRIVMGEPQPKGR